MIKTTGGFFSLDARGTLGGVLTGSFWKGVNYIRTRVIPNNPNSSAQQAVRQVMSDGVSKWRFGTIAGAAKTMWESYAAGTGMSGFNRFMSKYVPANYDSGTQEVVTPQVIPAPQ
jgi:hydrogenase maturation factor